MQLNGCPSSLTLTACMPIIGILSLPERNTVLHRKRHQLHQLIHFYRQACSSFCRKSITTVAYRGISSFLPALSCEIRSRNVRWYCADDDIHPCTPYSTVTIHYTIIQLNEYCCAGIYSGQATFSSISSKTKYKPYRKLPSRTIRCQRPSPAALWDGINPSKEHTKPFFYSSFVSWLTQTVVVSVVK